VSQVGTQVRTHFDISSCKCIFICKDGNSKTSQQKIKVRLMARCLTQREEFDYNDVLSPYAKHKPNERLLAMVDEFNLELEQMDIKIVFLYGDLEETVYLKQPKGFEIRDKKIMFLT